VTTTKATRAKTLIATSSLPQPVPMTLW